MRYLIIPVLLFAVFMFGQTSFAGTEDNPQYTRDSVDPSLTNDTIPSTIEIASEPTSAEPPENICGSSKKECMMGCKESTKTCEENASEMQEKKECMKTKMSCDKNCKTCEY